MSDAVDKSYAIKALDAGSILDHTIYLYRDQFKLVAAIMGLFLFPMLVVMDAILLAGLPTALVAILVQSF